MQSCKKVTFSTAQQCRRQEGKGDDDIDAILTQLDLKEKQARKVEVVTNCKAPEPRVCGLWLPLGDLVSWPPVTKLFSLSSITIVEHIWEPAAG